MIHNSKTVTATTNKVCFTGQLRLNWSSQDMTKYGNLSLILHELTYLLFHLSNTSIYIIRYFFRTHFIIDLKKIINNIFDQCIMDCNDSKKPLTSPSGAS